MQKQFDGKLAKLFGVKKITGLDKFSLFGGIIGLAADTIGIATSARGLFIPTLPKPDTPPEAALLITAVLGLYFLTLLIWFLIRFERNKIELLVKEELDVAIRTYDQISPQDSSIVSALLIPLIGVILIVVREETRVIFFLSVFISFLPVTLWIFTLTANPWLALGIRLFGGAFLSQYATFFALILDKFFY